MNSLITSGMSPSELVLIDLNAEPGQEVDRCPSGLFYLSGNDPSRDKLRPVDVVSEMTLWFSCARHDDWPRQCLFVRFQQIPSRRGKILLIRPSLAGTRQVCTDCG
jgi:hypothetical protein